MSSVNQAWLEYQRRRWLRPNWQLYVRPDAYRFAAPGTPEAKPPGYLHPSARIAAFERAQQEAAWQERAAWEARQRQLLEIRRELDELKCEIAAQALS